MVWCVGMRVAAATLVCLHAQAAVTEAELVKEKARLVFTLLREAGTLPGNVPMPIEFGEDPVEVQMELALTQLINVDQKLNQTECLMILRVSIRGSFVLDWVDRRFAWDHRPEFADADFVHIPLDSIWRPDIVAYFGGDTGTVTEDRSVLVRPSGNISVELRFDITTFCPVNVQRFPYDSLECPVTLGSWSYAEEFITVVPNPTPDLDNYYDNQEWILRGVSLRPGRVVTQNAGNFSTVIVLMDFDRQPFYYVFTLVIPATTTTTTAVFGMFAPVGQHEARRSRFQLGIVTMLPMGVLLLTIVDDLPKFAEGAVSGKRGSFSGVPALCIFYMTLLIVISVCTVHYSLFIWLEKRASDGAKMPKWLRYFYDRKGRRSGKHKASKKSKLLDNYYRQSTFRLGGRMLPRIALPVKPTQSPREESSKAEEALWQKFILDLERATLVFYLMIVVLSLFFFFNAELINAKTTTAKDLLGLTKQGEA